MTNRDRAVFHHKKILGPGSLYSQIHAASAYAPCRNLDRLHVDELAELIVQSRNTADSIVLAWHSYDPDLN